MHELIKFRQNIVIEKSIKRTIGLWLFLVFFVVVTMSDMSNTMANYQNFDNTIPVKYGISLLTFIFLFTFKEHGEFVLIPLTAQVVYTAIYGLGLDSIYISFTWLIIEIVFIMVTILALYKKIPGKIVNIIALCIGIYAIYSMVDILYYLGTNDMLSFWYIQWYLGDWALALAIALIFVGAKFKRTDAIPPFQITQSAFDYLAITCVVSGIMIFYGTFIVAAGEEFRSYTNFSGEKVFYFADRICPYVWTYLAMVVITFILFSIVSVIYVNHKKKN